MRYGVLWVTFGICRFPCKIDNPSCCQFDVFSSDFFFYLGTFLAFPFSAMMNDGRKHMQSEVKIHADDGNYGGQ